MRHIAVIGSGPAGYYAAEACQKAFGSEARIDIIDRLPVPYGLVRFGVAPDHQSIKAVARRFEAVALSDNVRFVGNVMIGRDVTVEELRQCYDAVILATGAPADRLLDIPGADLAGVIGSASFVGWYNGHADFADLNPPLDGANVAIIGMGNVALDVARILAKTPDEFAGSDIADHALSRLAAARIARITILGRRGPHQIAMTPKELGELETLARAQPLVDVADLPATDDDAALDPGQRKSISHLRHMAAEAAVAPARTIGIAFDFFARPIAIEGDNAGRAARVMVERTRIGPAGDSIGTGEIYQVPADLVISCIGYRTPAIEGVPYDARAGRFANVDGRIAPGLYVVGWARRGPSGTIGTNRPDGFAAADQIVEDLGADAGKSSGKGGARALDALLVARDVATVTFSDWQKIDAAEIARARAGAPREKFTSIAAMLGALAD